MGLRRFPDFEVGFGPTELISALSSDTRSFHSFEVGFGLEKIVSDVEVETSFHSFEVGFGPGAKSSRFLHVYGFHSFEVGFGLNVEADSSSWDGLFSFLRGRLRTKKEKRKKGEEANEVFVSFFGKQTRNMGLRRFHSFEVGFGRCTGNKEE